MPGLRVRRWGRRAGETERILSKWQKDPTTTGEKEGVCGGDIGNFHITWGPVISLSSMFPSEGKRESQGADNAECDRNYDENGIPNT